MNRFFQKLFLIAGILLFAGVCNVKAQSTVYFFVDFRFWNSEYDFKANGNEAFKLIPEGKPVVKGSDVIMYNMVARKVTFTNPGSYVIAVDCPSAKGNLHAELNLNLEDGETYYVLLNSSMKRALYMESVEEKEGLKLLKKAQKSNKYTINEDFTYNGK
jgi:hypothetical protein